MKLFGKILMGAKSVCVYTRYKISYGNRLKMSPVNSMRGGDSVELFSNAWCSIGKFLMSRGPLLYIKCTVGVEIKIGDGCFFNNNCSITATDSVIIGNHCMFANNLAIVGHDHKRENGAVIGNLVSELVVIGNNVWCGANVTILKGVTIGDGAVIAAGAVVRKNVESHSLVGGIPARRLKITI